MNTYETYQAAKIANPESEILKARDDWEGCQELIGKFIANKPNPEGGKPYIGKFGFEICNPADYCMTIKQFLDAGHKLFAGDIYLCREVGAVTIPEGQAIVDNTAYDGDDKLYVLKAKALEETKTYRYEKVGGEWSVWEYLKEYENSCDDDPWFYKLDSEIEEYAPIFEWFNVAEILRAGSKLYRRIEVTERELEIEEMTARLWGVAIPIDANKLASKLHELGFGLVNGKG